MVARLRQVCDKLQVVEGLDALSREAQRNATLLFHTLLRSTLASKRVCGEYRLNRAAFDWLTGEVETRWVGGGGGDGGLRSRREHEGDWEASLLQNTPTCLPPPCCPAPCPTDAQVHECHGGARRGGGHRGGAVDRRAHHAGGAAAAAAAAAVFTILTPYHYASPYLPCPPPPTHTTPTRPPRR